MVFLIVQIWRMALRSENIGWDLSFKMMCKNNGGKWYAFKINKTRLNMYIARAAKIIDYPDPLNEYREWVEVNNKKVEDAQKTTKLEKKIKQYKLDSPVLSQMQKEILEYQLYLQGQTPEQFKLAKEHGWQIAKALTEVKPNFHEGYVG